jgi:hypothetical protein
MRMELEYAKGRWDGDCPPGSGVISPVNKQGWNGYHYLPIVRYRRHKGGQFSQLQGKEGNIVAAIMFLTFLFPTRIMFECEVRDLLLVNGPLLIWGRTNSVSCALCYLANRQIEIIITCTNSTHIWIPRNWI